MIADHFLPSRREDLCKPLLSSAPSGCTPAASYFKTHPADASRNEAEDYQRVMSHPKEPPSGSATECGQGFARGSRGRWLAAAMFALLVPILPTAAFAAAEGGTQVDPFIFRLSIFVLAVFVGYYVVWSVTPALHTPLMSVTNAISSVIVVGALLAVGIEHASGDLANADGSIASHIFGFLALIMASVNIFGGFLVTSRMLAMYKKKEKK